MLNFLSPDVHANPGLHLCPDALLKWAEGWGIWQT